MKVGPENQVEFQSISSLSGLNEANDSTEKHVGDVEESPEKQE